MNWFSTNRTANHTGKEYIDGFLHRSMCASKSYRRERGRSIKGVRAKQMLDGKRWETVSRAAEAIVLVVLGLVANLRKLF